MAERRSDMGRGDSSGGGDRSSKTCEVCGRTIEWRRKWERDFDRVRFCSDACRRRGRSASARRVDTALAEAIVALLGERSSAATICPSEAARRVGGDDWRSLMEPARAAARRLEAAGEVVITQGGRRVDPSMAKGPIRIGRAR